MKRCLGLSPQLEQRVNIAFCCKLGWTFCQIKDALEAAFGQGHTLSDRRIYHWIREFRGGRTTVVDLPRAPKRPRGRSRVNIRKVEDLVVQDRKTSITAISAKSGITCSTVHRILKTDLKLVKKCAKFVPRELNDTQLARRVQVCTFWNRLLRTHPAVIRNIVTMYESWVYLYDPLLKVHSREWMRREESRPQKPMWGIGIGKVMLGFTLPWRRVTAR